MAKPASITLFIFLVGSFYTYGQVFKGTVTDEISNEPLPYANVSVIGKNIGDITLSNGAFELDLSSASSTDTIRFSYIGYESISFAINALDFSAEHVIALTPITYQIDPVTITATKKEIDMLGNKKAGRRMTGWGDFQSYRGRTRGLLIEGADCPTKVKSFSFRINHNDWDSVAFRLNFLSMENGEPGNSILTENIIFHTDKKHKWVKIDLEQYDIIICNEILATLEWVDAWGSFGEYSNLLTLSLSKDKGYVYSKEANEVSGTFLLDDHVPAIFMEAYRN